MEQTTGLGLAGRLGEDPAEAAILDAARSSRVAADQAEIDLAVAALAWCHTHPGSPGTVHAATGSDGSISPGGETVRELAGPGAPTVAEFAVAEFAAAARMSTQAGAHLLGNVLELAYRLPRLWAALLDGRIQVWRARRVADHTASLSLEAAGWIDGRIQTTRLTSIGPRTIEKLIEAALAEFDPDTAERRRRERMDERRVDIPIREADINGLVPVYALLDAPDALDLDAALNTIATHLGTIGSPEPHRVRRAIALGHLARCQNGHPHPGDPVQPTLLESDSSTSTPGSTGPCSAGPGITGTGSAPSSGGIRPGGTTEVGTRRSTRADEPPPAGAPPDASPRDASPPDASPPDASPPRVDAPGGSPPDQACPLPPDPGRAVVLYVHIPAETLTHLTGTTLPSGALPSGALPSGALPSGALPSGALPSGALPSGALPGIAVSGAGVVGRLANTRTPVLTETIRQWCGAAGRISVRPVIDLNSEAHTEAYEIPDRIHEHVQLRDVTCVFPYCTRPAVSCDTDHITPYTAGGPTSTTNLAALCRHHHRLKTHTPWRYDTTTPDGTYHWTSPTGHTYRRDHAGTTRPGIQTWKVERSRVKAATTAAATRVASRARPRPAWLQPIPPGPRTRARTLESILTPPPKTDPGEPPF